MRQRKFMNRWKDSKEIGGMLVICTFWAVFFFFIRLDSFIS
jgi:hypothetical protein